MGLGLGIAGAGINLVTGIVKGITAKKAHEKYAKELSGLSMEMPSAISEVEGIRSDLAYADMPGYADMMAGVDSGTATTMTGAKKVATSPSALMDALISSSTAGEAGKRELGIKNAMFQREGQSDLARFLSTVKAPAEQRINQFEIDKQIGVAKENMMGSKALMEGIEGGIGSAFGAFGSGVKLDDMQKRTQGLLDYWGNGGSSKSGGDITVMNPMSFSGFETEGQFPSYIPSR